MWIKKSIEGLSDRWTKIVIKLSSKGLDSLILNQTIFWLLKNIKYFENKLNEQEILKLQETEALKRTYEEIKLQEIESKLKTKFWLTEISIQGFEQAIKQWHKWLNIASECQKLWFDLEYLYEKGLAEWLNLHTNYSWYWDSLLDVIEKHKWKEYRDLLEKARLTAWRAWHRVNYYEIMTIFELLRWDPDFTELWINDLFESENINNFLDKMDFYKKLSKWNITDFYTYRKGVELFKIWDFSISIGAWEYESYGWLYLFLTKWNNEISKEIVHVWWYLFWNSELLINNIQWWNSDHNIDLLENTEEFKETYWIMPANLILLIYLKLSQLIGHDKVMIKSHWNNPYCYQEVKSSFYDIPKFYFRIKKALWGNYEFDWKKRDEIIKKFARKNQTVANAFRSLEDYYESL